MRLPRFLGQGKDAQNERLSDAAAALKEEIAEHRAEPRPITPPRMEPGPTSPASVVEDTLAVMENERRARQRNVWLERNKQSGLTYQDPVWVRENEELKAQRLAALEAAREEARRVAEEERERIWQERADFHRLRLRSRGFPSDRIEDVVEALMKEEAMEAARTLDVPQRYKELDLLGVQPRQ